MKRIIMTLVLFILLAPVLGMATNVTLGWDGVVGADGYTLYDRNFQKPYNYAVPSWTGSTLTGTVTVPDDRQSAFVARAFVWGPYDLNGVRTQIPSGNSNEVIFPGVTKPAPPAPQNLLIKILVAIGHFFSRLLG